MAPCSHPLRARIAVKNPKSDTARISGLACVGGPEVEAIHNIAKKQTAGKILQSTMLQDSVANSTERYKRYECCRVTCCNACSKSAQHNNIRRTSVSPFRHSPASTTTTSVNANDIKASPAFNRNPQANQLSTADFIVKVLAVAASRMFCEPSTLLSDARTCRNANKKLLAHPPLSGSILDSQRNLSIGS